MKRYFALAVVGLLSVLAQANLSHAALVVTPILTDTSIVEGTPTIGVTLSFSGSGQDVGASFDAFTYGLEAINAGVGNPAFIKPVNDTNLAPALSLWQLIDQSEFGDPNQVAGNANAPTNGSVALPSAVMTFTLDTSGLLAGDEVTISPNLFGIAAVSFRGTEYALDLVDASFTVTPSTAIPEPNSFAVLGLALSCVAVRRRTRA